MKLCGITTLLDEKRKNEDNEALGSTTLLDEKEKIEYHDALCYHNIVG